MKNTKIALKRNELVKQIAQLNMDRGLTKLKAYEDISEEIWLHLDPARATATEIVKVLSKYKKKLKK
jgi:hypothetical protein